MIASESGEAAATISGPAPARSSEPEPSGAESIPKRVWGFARSNLEAYGDPLLKLAGVFALGWSALLVLLAPNEYDLLVWVDETKALYPSPETEDRSVRLSYDGIRADSVDLLTIGIQNAGNKPIGGVDKTWALSITQPKATRAVLVGVVHKEPHNLKLKAAPGEPNGIHFTVGVLQPRSKIKLLVALVYTGEQKYGPLRVRTSLPGLPVQESAPPPMERLAFKLIVPLWLAIFLFVGLPELLKYSKAPLNEKERAELEQEIAEEEERLHDKLHGQMRATRVIRRALANASGSLLLAGMLAFGVGWVLAFFM